MNIGFVSCVKTKREGCFPAQDLYISPLFKSAFAYASLHCARVFILSAKHGLLRPEQKIKQYDRTLGNMSKVERTEWSRHVIKQIQKFILPHDKLHFFWGKDIVNI